MDQILAAYPKDVRFVYKQFPLPMHSGAMPAAKAAIAAANQGKYWEMHDELFKRYRELGNPETIRTIAKELGLDVARFEKDMASSETQKLVDEDMNVGRSADVQGTPTFFINGRRVINRSPEGMKAMVEDELKKKT